jgi:hypothetical protein
MKETIAEKEDKILDVPRIVIYVLELLVVAVLISFIFLSKAENKDYTGVYSEHVQKAVIESLVTSLELYHVHDVPYLGITPKIQIYIREDAHFVNAYYLEIIKGEVIIKDGETADKDIIIRTTEEEVNKIVLDNNYIKESMSSGRTVVEKATSDLVLFTKGYPDIFIESNKTK